MNAKITCTPTQAIFSLPQSESPKSAGASPVSYPGGFEASPLTLNTAPSFQHEAHPASHHLQIPPGH